MPTRRRNVGSSSGEGAESSGAESSPKKPQSVRRSTRLKQKLAAEEGKPATTFCGCICNMFVWCLVCAFTVLTLVIGVLTAIIVFVPSPVTVYPYSLPEPPYFEGPLSPNNALMAGVHVLEGEIAGPESLAVSRDGKLYTGLADGRIIEIVNDKISRQWRFTKAPEGVICGAPTNEPLCGRPLGLKLRNEDRTLFVLDPYLGFYELDIAQGKFHQHFIGNVTINGRSMRFLNDLDFIDDQNVVITDSSSKYSRNNFPSALFTAQPDGRVIQYNLETKKFTVLIDQLYFPNGIIVLNDGSILVAECGMARIFRIALSGDRVGEKQIFADNLPGAPDNIRINERNGNVWVPFALVRSNDRFSFHDFVGPRPWIRELLFKIFTDDQLLDIVALFFKLNAYGLVVELDMRGRIVKSYQDPTGSVTPAASHVAQVGPYTYIGSFKAPFLVKVKLS